MNSSKNKIEVKLIQGNVKISNPQRPDVDYVMKLASKGALVEEIVDPAMIISRLDYPVEIDYNESKIRLSPRAKLKVADISLLGELPNGVVSKRLHKSAPVKKSSKVKSKK